ncbi:MAG: phosphate transport system regulatory protein PhoU [Nitrospirae bacterium GWC2_42_7]|nr:MAG: phosphate transport system regulatory protein PhoU [Nitrospirae bacterium GWC2_42_7]
MSIFDDELQQLKEKILKMGSMVEEAIKNSVQSLVERDNALAIKVIDGDRVVNTLDVEIDEESIRLIALRQPKAKDLRFITMAMKITTDLERMGDMAVNIAERALELNEEPLLKPYIDIPKMREIAQGMTRDALDSFVRKDKKLAMDVIMRDDEVDKLKHAVLHELAFFMVKDPTTVTRAMKISFVAQYLERIADHATNIAEMVIYLIDGKIIRHMALPHEN